MNTSFVEIERRGKRSIVPALSIGDRTLIITGKLIRTARVHQEEWMEGEPVENPDAFISNLRKLDLKADIFNFSKRLPKTDRDYSFPCDWDNVAAIPISSYDQWLKDRVSRKTRQEVNRAQRLGVIVKSVSLSDNFITEVVSLFNRISLKQGRPFSHHGKDFMRVKKDISPYSDRSEFIAAHYKDELIGYIKIVYMGRLASILNIITDPQHFEKRPSNVLLAEAIKICETKNILYLIFGKYAYGNKQNDSVTEFKRRNGFEMIQFPRYYIPLNLKGRIIIELRLYRGIIGLLPESIISMLLVVRSWLYKSVIIPIKSLEVLQKLSRIISGKATRR